MPPAHMPPLPLCAPQACIRLDATDSTGTSFTASQSGMALASVVNGVATCTATRQGVYLVVQHAKAATPPAAAAKAPAASPSPVASAPAPPVSFASA
jgi:hypothetical protein